MDEEPKTPEELVKWLEAELEGIELRGSALTCYRLVGQTPVPCKMTEWGETFSREDRRVMLTRIGPFRVSTVFLGIDHNFASHGPPILFETMTFLDAPHGQYNDFEAMNDEDGRSSTWLEAEATHRRAVRFLKVQYCAPGEEPLDITGEDWPPCPAA